MNGAAALYDYPNIAIDGLRLDHVGIIVRDLTTAISTFKDLFGYRQATEPVTNSHHKVSVVFLEKENSIPIKLFSPTDGGPAIATRLHHLAFFADNLEQAIDTLKSKGAILLSEPTPGEAFDDEPIAFLFAGGLNIEVFSTTKRRRRRPSELPPHRNA